MRLYGEIHFNAISLPAIVEISAWINGTEYVKTTVKTPGAKTVYVLDIPGDDPDTIAIEGAQPGDIVSFQINGISADQTLVWESGAYVQLDLTATVGAAPPLAQDQTLTTGEDTPLAVTLQATDINGDALEYDVAAAPTRGALTGTAPDLLYIPAIDYNGTDSLTFTANDGTSASNVATVSINIAPVPDAPRLAPINDPTVIAGATLDVPITATDPEGDAITINSIGRPAFAGLVDNGDGSAVLSLSPGLGDVGVYSGVEIVAEDATGLKGRTTIVIRVQPNQSPDLVVSSFSLSEPNPPRGATVDLSAQVCNRGAGAVQNVPVRFTVGDPATGTQIGEQVIASLVGGGCQSVTQPLRTAGLSPSQLLYATVDPANTIAELDETNNHAIVTLNLSGAIDNVPPEIRSTPVTSAQTGSAYAHDVNAVDLDGDSLTYRLTTAPQGMAIDARTGLITWWPQSYDIGLRTVEVEADDGFGGRTSQRFDVDVTPDNYPPTITSTPIIDATPDTRYTYDVDASDPEGTAVEFFLADSPTGMSIEHSTGIIRWTPSDTQLGLHNVIVEARDAGGASAAQGFGVRVLGDGVGTDLVVTRVDNRPVQVDTQALTLSGTVDVTIGNAGNQDVVGAFDLLLFADADNDARYTAGVDTTLGQSTVSAGLAAGQAQLVSVPVTGAQDFRDDLIYAWVDAAGQVTELDEDNNYGDSGRASQFHPRPGPFTPALRWAWTGDTVEPEYDDVMMTPLVVNLTDDNGDALIDANDIADLVFVSGVATTQRAGILRAVSGADGTPLWSVTDPTLRAMPYHPIAAGDLDGDGLVEIVVVNGNAQIEAPPSPNESRIMIFEHDGTLKGIGDLPPDFGAPMIADLEADGTPEIVIANRVYNADGTLRWAGSRPFLGSGKDPVAGAVTPASPALVDLDLDGKLELVTGVVAYRADGSIFYDVSSNPLLQAYTVLQGGGRYAGGYSAVGNFNADPYPEIAIVALQVTLLDHNGNILWQADPNQVGSIWGPPTIADFDGDGQPEIGGSSKDYYTVFDTDGTLLWRKQIVENSGFNGSSVFDFEGDGAMEVVYNDIHYLRILRGSDGETLFQVPNPTGTFLEEPVVADVNNDGTAEIIVARNQFGFNGSWVATDSGVFVYGDKWNNWVGTRRIWNQHAYHITNVNEDGTIPAQQIPNWTYYNSYRANAQVPAEAQTGPYAVPDLTASFIQIDQITCPVSTTLSARIGNGGGDIVPAGVPVSFYDGDPDLGAPLIGTAATSTLLRPGEATDVSVIFDAPPSAYRRLTVVADDGGGSTLVESTDLAHLPGTRVADHFNFNTLTYKVESAIDGNVATSAVAAPNASFLEIAFAQPVNVDALKIAVPAFTNNPKCWTTTTAVLTLSNGYTTPLNVTCSDGQVVGALPYYTPPMPRQEGITSFRIDFNTDPTSPGINVGEIFVEGSYYDSRRGTIAEGREDNNRAAYSVALCGATVPGNATPEITSAPPANATAGIAYRYDAVATDLDGDPLTFSLAAAPAGMVINPNSGRIDWVPQTYQVGTHSVGIAVNDGRGGVANQAYSVTVAAISAQPLFTSLPITQAQIGVLYSYLVAAGDPEGTPLVFALVDPPSGMSINAATGQIYWTPVASQVGTHLITVEAKDGSNVTAQQTYILTVLAAGTGQDLVLTAVDNRATATDLQSLALSGAVSVTFGNIGDTAIAAAFDIVLFADANGSKTYEAGVDIVLGSTTQPAGLAAGVFRTLPIAVNGTVKFRDDLIFGLVDATDAVAESDETNNGANSGQRSNKALGDLAYRIVTEQSLAIPNPRLSGAPLVANLNDDNGDGVIDERDIPEVIYADDWNVLRAFRTDTGQQLWGYTSSPAYNFENFQGVGIPAAADLDGDGAAEIIITHANGDRVIIFNSNGTPRLVSAIWPNRIGAKTAVSVVNIDRTGPPEILAGNALVNSDGTLRCQGTGAIGVPLNNGYQSTAVDLDLSGDMEFVVGNKAYRSDCSLYWANSALPDGFVSVGNLDADPNPEIVLIGTNSTLWVLEHDGTVKFGPITAPGGFARGMVTIADFDGDGMAEIGAIGNNIAVLEADLTQNWAVCCNFFPGTAFDFDADGRAEIVATADSGVNGASLRIYDGATGAERYRYEIRPSINSWPYPTVADVDGDGSAEILVPTDRGLKILGNPAGDWANTKRFWPQQTHHDVNINDDGSIPLSEPPYSIGRVGFKQNPARLDAADITASKIEVNQNVCPANVEVTARIGNGGSAVLPAGTAVGLYDTASGLAEVLAATGETSVALAPGQYEDVSFLLQSPVPGIHGLRAVANYDLRFDNLNWLPGVTASGSRAVNGLPPSRLFDASVHSGWCSSAIDTTYVDISYPYPVNVSSVTIEPDGVNIFNKYTTGAIELSNGFTVPATFDANGRAVVTFPAQTGITTVRFTSPEKQCMGELGVGGTVTEIPSTDGTIALIDGALVNQWPLDGSAVDVSAQANSGRLLGNPAVAAGVASPALVFDGNDDAVAVDSYNMPSGDLSIAMWVRTDDTLRNGTLVSFANDTYADRLKLANYRNLQFCQNDFCAPASGVSVNDGRWHHVVLTLNQALFRLYVDGQLVQDTGGYGALLGGNGTLVFGQDQDRRGGGFQTSEAFAGTMDDIKVFNRMLTLEEINIEYNLRQNSSWTYSDRLGEGRSDNNQVIRTVELCVGANTPPVITSTALTNTLVGQAYTYDVNATDADGDIPTFRLLVAPTGMAIASDSGIIQWTPAAAQVGSFPVTVEAADGNGGLATQSFTLVVTAPPPVNHPPACADLAFAVDEDGVANVTLSCTDPDAFDTVSIALVATSTAGQTTLSGNRATYRPLPNYNGPDSFTFQATDQRGLSSTVAVATITVNPVNDPPVAAGQTLTVTAGSPLSITLGATDVEVGVLSYELIITPYYGQLTGVAPEVAYTADPDYSGPDVLTFRVNDGQANSQIAVVNLTVLPRPRPDLRLEMSDEISIVVPGQFVTYTLTMSNAGTAPALGAILTDTLPAHVVVIDPDGGQETGSEIIWQLGDLAVDTQITRTLTLQVADLILDDAAEITNSAIVSAVNGASATVTDTNLLDAAPVLQLAKDDQRSQVQPGDRITYTIALSNTGNRVASGTVLTDTLPPYVELIEASAGGISSAGQVTWTFDELLPQSEVTTTVVVSVAQSVPAGIDAITNTVTAIDISGIETSATDTDMVNASPDLVVTKDDGREIFDPGTVVTYTLAVQNVGNRTATEVILTDTLPVSTTLLGTSDSPTISGDSIVWSLGAVDVQATVTRTVTLQVVTSVGLPAAITNTATVATAAVDNPEPNDANNRADDTTRLNRWPVALDDLSTTDERTPVQIDVLANDSDPDGDGLSITQIGPVTSGTASTDGISVTYTPAIGFVGSTVFTYTISDGTLQATAQVTATVANVNDAPNARPDTATTQEDTATTVDVLANDDDPDGDLLTIVSVGASNTGDVTTDVATVTYTPAANFNGTAVFTYTVSDGALADTATVTVTVTAVNDAPIAVDDTATTTENTAAIVDVLANDSDPDGDPLVLTAIGEPTIGVAAIEGSAIVYTPTTGFAGSSVFTYTVSDGEFSESATVTVAVSNVNDAPVAVDDVASTDEDVPVTVSVLDNDSDPDGDLLTVTAVTGATGGVATTDGASVTFTPDADFNGVATVDYVISDGSLTASATVTITVNAVNDPPIAIDDLGTTDEETPVVIAVLANDSDVDGDALAITAVGAPTSGNATTDGTTITYTPVTDFAGIVVFAYTLSDGQLSATALVTVTVNNVNDAPIAVDDMAATNENTAISIDVLANDVDVDGDPLTIVAAGSTTAGTVTSDGAAITFSPNGGFIGTAIFTYTVSDGQLTATANVAVVVNNVNDPPVAVDDTAATNEDTPVTIDVLANDSDPDGDTLTVLEVGLSAAGAVTTDGTTVTFSPGNGFAGVANFTYTVGDGQLTATAAVTVVVNAVNQAPVAVDDEAVTNENTTVTVDALANDYDPDGDPLTITAVGTPSSGTATTDGQVITYSPEAGFAGAASFTYVVSDGSLTASATITVLVNNVNDSPIAVDDTFATDEDSAVTIPVLANDSDPDGDPLTVTGLGPVTNGQASTDGATVTYVPAPDFNGIVNFVYTIWDGVLSATANVTVDIRAVNDPPVAADDLAATAEDTPVTIDVLLNDSDVDGDVLSVAMIGAPSFGGASVAVGGNLIYTPTSNFFGTDSFAYTVTDGSLADTAKVTVTVQPVNDAPVANDDLATTALNTPVTIPVLANDTDIDGDVLIVLETSQPVAGTASVNPDQTVLYTPPVDFTGSVSFTYRVGDSGGMSVTAVVTVSVIPSSNNAPQVGPIAAPLDPVAANSVVTVRALFSDTDPGDTHTAVWEWGDGTTSSGTITGQSVEDAHTYPTPGVYTIRLTVTDSQGASGTSVFTFVVVYDPNAGFVTGGGWIWSMPGSCLLSELCVGAEGRANFGFVSKYKKGANVPTGSTQFQFQAGTLNFHSDVYEWLVVAGANAKFKGTGTINGAGNYGFMITATDGELSGGASVDGFRIKILDKANGDAVVYDNQMSATDDSNSTTALSGGSIVIHTSKNNRNADVDGQTEDGGESHQLYLPTISQ